VLERQGRLVRFKGNYYPRVVVPIQRQNQPQGRPISVMALDPGVRTLFTGFDNHGKVIELGVGDFTYLAARGLRADQIQSKIDRSYGPYADDGEKTRMKNRRRNLRKKCRHLHAKNTRCVTDCIHRAALFLLRNYDVICIPKFSSSQMVRRGTHHTFTHLSFFSNLKTPHLSAHLQTSCLQLSLYALSNPNPKILFALQRLSFTPAGPLRKILRSTARAM
jgi:transposase